LHANVQGLVKGDMIENLYSSKPQPFLEEIYYIKVRFVCTELSI